MTKFVLSLLYILIFFALAYSYLIVFFSMEDKTKNKISTQ